MKSLTSKEKWFQKFAKKARFTLSLTAFEKSADKAQQFFLAAERQQIPEKVICERLGEPKKLIEKSDQEERQLWRKPTAVLAVALLAADFLWWWRGWPYVMHIQRCLVILAGTLFIPRIAGFLYGSVYYERCASIMQKKQENMNILSAAAIVVMFFFLILDSYVFPFGIWREILGGVFQMVCFIVFHVIFFGLMVFLLVYGIREIQYFRRQGYKLIYMGNGMLHSFFALHAWAMWMKEPDLGLVFLGALVALLPFAADLLLFRIEQRIDGKGSPIN